MASSPPVSASSAAQNPEIARKSRIWSLAKKSAEQRSKDATGASNLPNSTPTPTFRQRFLVALQFYCDTPSLILNSDLPADLVEFVTSQTHPVDALSVILELKKGSKSNWGKSDPVTSARASELSRKLVESWMSADSCSEALGSLSLGDEVPGVIAETSSLHRLLFAISDTFHIPPEYFATFLLTQVNVTIASLAWGVRVQGYQGKIRSQVLASLLDRTFLRFHSDSEQFYSQTPLNPRRGGVNVKVNVKVKDKTESKPFSFFIQELSALCRDDFIARRLVSKILLGFGSQSANKFAKTLFLLPGSPASILLFPAEDFYSNPTWNQALRSNIPLKTVTKSRRFWSNWASFIYSSTSSGTASLSLSEVWESGVANWAGLCGSSLVNCDILLPATYALIALAREIKLGQVQVKGHGGLLSCIGQVFESVGKCLDTTNEEKRACGMALAQVVGDLQSLILNPGAKPQITPAGMDQIPGESDGGRNNLRFTSSNPVFLELIDFYENGVLEDVERGMKKLDISGQKTQKFKVLDSDDDDEEEEEESFDDVNETWINSGEGDQDEDHPIDERILDYRSKKGRLPQYFSEIMEILVEGGGGNKGNEAEMEALKYFCIMRIPLLLHFGVRIDSNMGVALVKALLDYESGTGIEVPILFALTELGSLHPIQIFETLATTAFDKSHYTSGHRMITLRRYAEVIQLLSKGKCFSCFGTALQTSRSELMGICPEFIATYFETKRRERLCSECVKKGSNSGVMKEMEGSTTNDGESGDDVSELTWREIVDLRVARKTRYFFTPRRRTPLPLEDVYSTKLLPIIWSSLSNRVISGAGLFLDEKERAVRGAPNDAILSQVFRLLGRVLLGSSASCPHLGVVATQVGELAQTFVSHPDASVRGSVYSLLAVLLTISDGAYYVVEAVSGGANLFQMLKVLRERETWPQNRALLDSTLAFLAQAATSDYRLQFSSTALESRAGGGDILSTSRLCFLRK